MIAFITARMMDMEVESLTGAGLGERSADRVNSRDGYRAHLGDTGGQHTAGNLQAAQGQLFPVLPGGTLARLAKGARGRHSGSWSLPPGLTGGAGRLHPFRR